MKVILGTGQLGLAILDQLLTLNPTETIVLVNRSGKIKRSLPENVQLLAADVTDNHKMEYVAREADVIFSCTDVPYQNWTEFYPAAASALAYALSRSGARLVFADNMYSYGNMSGEKMHEALPHIATTKKGRIRTQVINTLLFSGKSYSKRVAIVKAADFIGPEIHKGVFGTDFLDRLYNEKTIPLFGKIDLKHTFTYIHDFAEAMINIASADDAFGQVWHVPNAEPMDMRSWLVLFEKYSGKKTNVKTIPKFLVKIGGLFNPLLRELYELAYQFEFPYLVDHTKYVNRFGNHACSHEHIVKETLTWFEKKSTKK